MALKRLVLIRPGETDWNLNGRLQGWVAIPLNGHGREQAARLANFIRNLGLSRLYSSDNRRAVDTAKILAQQLGFEPILDSRLRERNIGHWQGLTVPEVHGWYADEYAQLLADPENFVIPNGESMHMVKQRTKAALNDILKQADVETDTITVGVISHTTAIRVMLSELIPGTKLDHVNFGNTSATTVMRNEDGSWRLVATNDCMHLEGLESRYMPEVENE